MSHLDELEIHQTARYRYISVVLGCPRGGRADWCHPAPWAVLHPPGAMHGQVEGQNEVRILREDRGSTSASDHKQITVDEKHYITLISERVLLVLKWSLRLLLPIIWDHFGWIWTQAAREGGRGMRTERGWRWEWLGFGSSSTDDDWRWTRGDPTVKAEMKFLFRTFGPLDQFQSWKVWPPSEWRFS